ncbi:hypothetical protein VTN31DRAFT_2239 [Thermomyces dupontii]|uniref:uncharacterized protein n=1 Tax=Talaromyces thermophilus TaxID=28565 RepID=UPI0037430260
MVINYSKWDALELSDDSDIEVHPNVDKRSFIRAKQNQIHQQRAQRRQEIQTLKYERIINDGLLERIDKLLNALNENEGSGRSVEEVVFQVVMEIASDPSTDQPPETPAGVHSNVKEQPKYSQMMSSLVDQVKKEVEETKAEDKYRAYIEGVQGHKNKVNGLQEELLKKLAELEREEKSKITSDDIHTGFDSSFVNKSKPSDKAKGKQKEESVELLNPEAVKRAQEGAQGGDDDDDDADVKASDVAKEFAKIKIGDYRACLQFISEHPELMSERETDGLLVEAFNAQMEGKDEYARQCVHQGLLIQYCRSLGRDGINLFFKRITTKDHQAATLFRNDVNETYNKIKTRAAELAKNRSPENDPAGVEQIQLHAVDPNTKINIRIPPKDSTVEEEIEARKIFDSFPPDLQRALESESLDEVNKVLGKMSVPEAEDVVEKLSQGGMLSLEEGIVDATTEEGKKKLEELEAEGKRERQEAVATEDVGEPAD